MPEHKAWGRMGEPLINREVMEEWFGAVPQWAPESNCLSNVTHVSSLASDWQRGPGHFCKYY